VQVKVYVETPVPADTTVVLPLMAGVPLQAPLAVHAVAFVLVHARVTLAPALVNVGVAERVTVGNGGALTVTVADPAAVPSFPVQVSV
jgi:hypothetical protein